MHWKRRFDYICAYTYGSDEICICKEMETNGLIDWLIGIDMHDNCKCLECILILLSCFLLDLIDGILKIKQIEIKKANAFANQQKQQNKQSTNQRQTTTTTFSPKEISLFLCCILVCYCSFTSHGCSYSDLSLLFPTIIDYCILSISHLIRCFASSWWW